MIVRETATTLELSNGVIIEIDTASFKTRDGISMTTSNVWIAFVLFFAPIPFVVNYALGRRAKWWQAGATPR